jgi:hypothetical protein
MALVKGTPQFLVETDEDGGLGFEDKGRQVTIVTSDNILSEMSKALVSPDQASTVTCYLFTHPTTQSGHLLLGQREVYVPTGSDGFYFGVHLGTKAKAHAAMSITDMGLFKPGLFTWHGALTKVGTWTNSPANPAAGTFNSTGALYSVTAGDTISGSITGTVAAIRVYNTSNGGNAIVAIDGDYTRANRLPTFTLADYDSGNCRWSDVGKRYISTYGPASFNDCICLAADLDAGTHTITVEVTGKYPAGSSAARVYVEGFAGCNGESLISANVYAVPVYWIYHDDGDWSAFGYTPQWAPSGSTDYQFMGEIHGDNVQSKEVTTSLAVYVGVTDQTALAAGTVASGLTVTIDHVSTLAHKSNTATPIATKTRKYTFTSGRKHPVMCSCKTVYSAAGVINIEYPVMLPVGELVNAYKGMSQPHFNKYYIGHVETPILGLNDNTVYYKATDMQLLRAVGNKVEAWAEVVSHGPDSKRIYGGYGGSYQDRSNSTDKAYVITATGPQPFSSTEIREFTLGWGAKTVT